MFGALLLPLEHTHTHPPSLPFHVPQAAEQARLAEEMRLAREKAEQEARRAEEERMAEEARLAAEKALEEKERRDAVSLKPPCLCVCARTSLSLSTITNLRVISHTALVCTCACVGYRTFGAQSFRSRSE